MEEIWKDVVGYEGRYQVSNLGNVRSIIYLKKGKITDLRLLDDGRDYLQVRLCKNGKGKMRRVHRLVAEAFIENPNNYPVVNHKNWDRRDNRVDNLEWCTYSYNNWYVPNRESAYGEKKKKKSGSKSGKPFASPKRVVCIETGEVFESISIAAKAVGVNQSNISRNLRGLQRSSAGFHWKYVDEESANVGSLTLADGIITQWQVADRCGDNIYSTGIFDLDDLRNIFGQIKFLIRDFGETKEICMCAADYPTVGA